MNEQFEHRLSAIEYELSQIAESEYLEELKEKFNGNCGKDVVVNIIPSRDISFKTRSPLSSILDRLELTHQDRLDLEKYIIYGGGDNIEKWSSNFKKKFIFDIDFNEIETDDTFKVTFYVGGVDALIARLKEFAAICTYYNEIGRLNCYSGILTCTQFSVKYDKSYVSIKDIKNNISYFDFSFGTTLLAEHQFAISVQIKYEENELFISVHEI